ncbi:hypothetical protein [Bradyrhizobium sp. Cp5.3]|uniref:hypothetical protein n=1 Tax=Bradyrhizobium sp. Cp5.3 TaxID=443598 RepID=UPI00042837D2|nr:hypothetical protein [Bradyrhizobium sp. Cp5.3]
MGKTQLTVPAEQSVALPHSLDITMLEPLAARINTIWRMMKIRTHSESHVVELDDGSRWQIFPGDLDLTLSWKPDTELHVEPHGDRVSSHVLINPEDQSCVRVIASGETWPAGEVKNALRDG